MNIASWTLIFSFLAFLASCQVSEKSGGSDLISGHTPVTNRFTIQTPTADTYVTTDTLSVTLSFPFVVTVDTIGGTPTLQVTIGVTTRNFTYSSGDGSKNLVFTYTVVGADNDTNGITVTGLTLNGGLLTFDNNGVVTNCSTTLSARTFASVLVDNTGPTITAFELKTVPGYYHVGDTLSFTMTFSEAVVVTGTPQFLQTFTTNTGAAAYATYLSGSGTTTLAFSYDITDEVADTNGFTFTSPLELNGGTITDAAGNSSSLDFSAYVAGAQAYSASVTFDGRQPYVVSVTLPANGTYIAAQDMDITVEFNRPVDVTGTHIILTFTATPRQATYLSGTGTSTIVYRYTLVPGDVDTNGVGVDSVITQNGGTILGDSPPDDYFTTANNVLGIPSTAGIIAAATQPQPTSVTRNVDSTSAIFGTALDNVWNIGQALIITVGFNTGMYVTQTGGTPRIPLTIGGSTQYATYLSGGNGQTSLLFTYTIQEGDLDSDGSIALGNIDLNGGIIADSANTNTLLTLTSSALTTTYIDGVRPTISSVTAPTDGTYSTITGNNHTNFIFTVTWSENVNYSTITASNLPLTFGVTAVNAVSYGTNNTTAKTYRPATMATYNDLDGITVATAITGAAVIRDAAGNTATVLTLTPPVTTSLFVDTTVPTVTSISAQPADDTYIAAEDLDFDVTFSESVTTNVSGGFPRISIVIGGTTRYLIPTANATATTHTFRYTIIANEVDTDGVVVGTSAASSGAGYVRDAGQNNVTGTFTSPTTTGILVDSQAPSISSVTRPVNGTYTSGETLTFSVQFSESVNVTGTPRIQLTAQTGTLNCDYASGTGTDTLEFTYTILGTDLDLDGMGSVTTIDLNSGTITDASTNASATTFTAEDLTAVYVAYPNIRIWANSSLTNAAPTGATTLSNSGASSTEACGTGTCRTFDGDDSLSNSTALNGVETAFIVFKAPAALVNVDIITGDVALTNDGSAFDFVTDNATISINGSPFSGTNHDTNLATGTTNILQIDYSAAPSYAGGVLIPTSFTGAIGEVIMIDAVLTGAQKSEILTYLNTKY